MNVSYSVLVVILVAIIAVLGIVQLFKEKSDNDISNVMLQTGVALLLSGIPSIAELMISLAAVLFSKEIPETGNTYVFMAVGFILILLSLIVRVKLKERIYVLNMLGIRKKEISSDKAKQDLKIADYKLKEQVLDIIPVFNDGTNMDEKANSYIVKQVRDDAEKFAVKSKESGGCFTGMAPIPYTIFAGTFLGEADVNRYFEFNRNAGETYYELKKRRIFQRRKWKDLEIINCEAAENATEIVLAISITHNVMDADLSQFAGMDIVRVGLSAPKDNVIEFQEQLMEYKKVIHDCLDTKLRECFPNLKTVHLVASIPSCMSIEIGKIIGMGTNRMMDIIVYHYIHSNTIKYPFGVYVSGSRKGTFVEVE